MKSVSFLSIILCVFLLSALPSAAFSAEKPDLVRLERVLAKLRRGEKVTIAGLGGSITTGFQAGSPATEGWFGLVSEWFGKIADQTGADLTCLNLGVSGTDSAFGAVRIQDQIEKQPIDLFFVEFAVNDQWLDKAIEPRSYEGVLRQILADPNRAALLLFLKEKGDNPTGMQSVQQPIGSYYKLPMVSWGEYLKPLISSGKVNWNDLYNGSEGIHPNNDGHASIAAAITTYLDSVWSKLPSDGELVKLPVAKDLPVPLKADNWEKAHLYGCEDITPFENTGWGNGSDLHSEWVDHGGAKQGWSTTVDGALMSFKIKADSIALTYAESDQYRNTEAWVEFPDGTNSRKVALMGYVSYRNGYLGWACKEIASGLGGKECILHIQVKKGRATEKGRLANVTGIILNGEKP